jgi:acetoin utilization deacetylase AcuC-like enzyme
VTAIYAHPISADHYAPGHPESPERVRVAVAALQRSSHASLLHWPEVRPVDPSLVAAVHSAAQVRKVENLASTGGGWIDPDTFVVPASYSASLHAAGAAVQATADVLKGSEQNGFAVMRPPGHHATQNRSMGFCLFNSVAIAAEWAIRAGGAQRVAIVDIDVHHGNGTQDIFYDRPDVLYLSTHQFPYYPGTGRVEDVGTHDGAGATVNLPLMGGCGDDTYRDAMARVIAPALRRFQPNLILVSLGFDAHWVDPLAQMRLSTTGYAESLAQLFDLAQELCEGHLVFLLEGGYDLQAIEEGCLAAASILLRQPPDHGRLGRGPSAPEPPRASALIDAVCAIHELPNLRDK